MNLEKFNYNKHIYMYTCTMVNPTIYCLPLVMSYMGYIEEQGPIESSCSPMKKGIQQQQTDTLRRGNDTVLSPWRSFIPLWFPDWLDCIM